MSTTWKKAFSTLATASLLASLFTAAVAAPVAAADSAVITHTGTAKADGAATVVVTSVAAGLPVGTTVRFSITDGTIPAFVGVNLTRVDASTIEFFSTALLQWGTGTHAFQVASTKVGDRTITVGTKAFGATSFTTEGTEDVTFTAVNATDLVTPIMAITAGACPASNSTATDPVDITTASGASTSFLGTAVGCAWVLLRQNDATSGVSSVSTGELSTWTFSLSPYGVLHSAANGLDAPVSSLTKDANTISTVVITTGAAAGTYTGAGVTIYANNTVGKTTINWSGTYRGKAYTASDSLTFTGKATGIKLTGAPASQAIGTGYSLGWTATDANGIAVSGSTGDLTTASSKETVAVITAVGGSTVTYSCLTTGTAVLTVATKTGVTPAFTSNGAAITCGAGAAATIKVTATVAKVGGISTITATVTDAKGLPVVEGTTVTFAANGGIFIDPDTFAFVSPYVATTKNGVATISIWVRDVPSVITVLAQNGGKTGIGTVVVTAAGTTASGITARVGTAAYAATTRVARLGQTITWRANLGSAAAGEKVGVYQRTRNANGTWSTIRRWATATADSSGVVTFSYKYGASKWIQIRFVDADGVHGSTSFLGGVWR